MSANFLIIGCGAREISIFRNLKKNKNNKIFFYVPYEHPYVYGESNGYKIFTGTLNFSECYMYCLEKAIKYVIIGSENYINEGIVDYFESLDSGIICIGPPKKVAKIETNKKFARNLLRNNNLNQYNPDYIYVTANTSFNKVIEFIKKYKNDVVVKANGLHSGKGVKVYGVHMLSLNDIIDSIYTILESGESLLIEERIDSDNEFSFMTFTDGIHFSHTFPIKDFKRLKECNEGPNTGSMACIYDCNGLHYINESLIEEAKTINEKVIHILNKYKEKSECYKGVLYGSFIVDKTCNLKVIEFNARLGDPETILIMESMCNNFTEICHHIANQTLHLLNVEYDKSKFAMCKYLVPKGYPENPLDKFQIDLTELNVKELHESCILGAITGIFGDVYGTKSRNIAVYATGYTDLYEAEAKIDFIMTKIIHRNKDTFYYRTNVAKDYEKYRAFNERLFLGFDMSSPIRPNRLSLQIDTDTNSLCDTDSEPKSNSDSYDEETNELLNSMIQRTVSDHVGLYLDSGVNIDEGNRAVKNISGLVSSTFDTNVVSEIGTFGGMYDLKQITQTCLNPVLVTSIDGVGTKSVFSVEHYQLHGFEMLGEDIVNHSINDILVQGAMPLFFTDYFASSVLNSDELYYFIKGVSKACKESNCVLIGGETAEMPNIYECGKHDLVGSIVGIVDKHEIINGKINVKSGDLMVAFDSSGPHTNGFSLIRKIYNKNKSKFTSEMIETLAKPHRCYLEEYIKICEEDINIHGMAHITGGGLLENIRRVVPDNLVVNFYNFEYSDIFNKLQEIGNVPDKEMQRVFNCGIGMIFIVNQNDANMITSLFSEARVIGDIL